MARDRGRDDRDVPARDRDDVADAGRRERRREVAVDPVAQADEDAGREARLGLGQDPGQGVARAPAERLEAAAQDRRGPAGRSAFATTSVPTAPIRSRYSPYGESGRGRIAALDDDAVAGDDLRVARERRGDAERAGRRRAASTSVATCWPSRGEPVASTISAHGPVPSGGCVEQGGSGWRDRQPDRR